MLISVKLLVRVVVEYTSVVPNGPDFICIFILAGVSLNEFGEIRVVNFHLGSGLNWYCAKIFQQQPALLRKKVVGACILQLRNETHPK